MSGRRKRSIVNTGLSLLSDFFVILVGMFFPRVLISCYGDATNGLISSLQQFAQYFTLISMGLSGAVVYALYSPLARSDRKSVEHLVASAGRVFSRMGRWYTAALVAFGALYPLLAADSGYSYGEELLMFIAIGINGASQLFYSGKYKALLSAAQKNGVAAAINAVFTVAFSGVLMLCALLHVPALLAVVLASLAYIGRAVAYGIAARRAFPGYSFRLKEEPHEFSMQREVMIQQILTLIVMNIPVIAMTVMGTPMEEISVFAVFNMVVTAVYTLSAAVSNGVSAGFGDLIARGDPVRLRSVFREFEQLFQMFWTVIAGCTAVLLPSFINVYTAGTAEAESYDRPVLCILFGILAGLWMIRIQLSTVVVAAGKYKEIQCHSIIEAVLSVVLGFAGLYFFGIEGLIASRVIVTAFRVVSFAVHDAKYVLGGELGFIFGNVALSSAVVAVVWIGAHLVQKIVIIDNLLEWGVLALATAAVLVLLSVAAQLAVNGRQTVRILGGIFRKFRR